MLPVLLPNPVQDTVQCAPTRAAPQLAFAAIMPRRCTAFTVFLRVIIATPIPKRYTSVFYLLVTNTDRVAFGDSESG